MPKSIPLSIPLSISALACAVSGAAGFLAGSSERPEPTEYSAARLVSGDENVRLVGHLCGDHGVTVLARQEDEFPDYCREIRRLGDGE